MATPGEPDLDSCYDMFLDIDQNGNGVVDASEIEQAFSKLLAGKKIPKSFVDARMAEMDKDRSGEISFDEYVKAITGKINRGIGETKAQFEQFPLQDRRLASELVVQSLRRGVRNGKLEQAHSDELVGMVDGEETIGFEAFARVSRAVKAKALDRSWNLDYLDPEQDRQQVQELEDKARAQEEQARKEAERLENEQRQMQEEAERREKELAAEKQREAVLRREATQQQVRKEQADFQARVEEKRRQEEARQRDEEARRLERIKERERKAEEQRREQERQDRERKAEQHQRMEVFVHQEVTKSEHYAQEHGLDKLFAGVVAELVRSRPDNVAAHTATFLSQPQ